MIERLTTMSLLISGTVLIALLAQEVWQSSSSTSTEYVGLEVVLVSAWLILTLAHVTLISRSKKGR